MGATADAVDVALAARAHDLGPTLAAAFANSPFDALGRADRLALGAPRGLGRDRSVAHRRRPTGTARRAATSYAAYALDAPVMMINASATHSVAMRDTVAFSTVARRRPRARVADDRRLRATTSPRCSRRCDPRGWLELRMIDALPGGVVAGRGRGHRRAARRPRSRRRRGRGRRPGARQLDRRRPRLARGARAARRRRAVLRGRAGRVRPPRRRRRDRCAPPSAFHDRYVARGRCPADDRLDKQAAHAVHRRLTVVTKTGDRRTRSRAARRRTLGLLDPVPAADQARQVSPLMSPLCWDLAHIGHYEELWLIRELDRRRADRPALRRHLRRVQAPAP